MAYLAVRLLAVRVSNCASFLKCNGSLNGLRSDLFIFMRIRTLFLLLPLNQLIPLKKDLMHKLWNFFQSSSYNLFVLSAAWKGL